MKNKWTIILFCSLLFLNSNASHSQTLNHLYKGGEEGYQCYRIPSLITTNNGTLLAFAEARKNNCKDAGDIDLVVKRSDDGGKTWSALQVVWDDSANTCGNPAPVVDRATGNIILITTWNLGSDHEKDIENGSSKDTRRVFVLSSTDDGLTWSKAKQITTDVKKDNWTWYATGPGQGIQVSKGKYKGRLVIPCNYKEAITNKNFSHAIYSDDKGLSWKLGGITPVDGLNEATMAELSNGELILNMRNSGPARTRKIAISKDGAASWSPVYNDTILIEPVCEASLISYRAAGKKWMAFSNPASKTARVMMTVRISKNNGKTWPLKKVLYTGPSAYSCLTQLPNGNLGCLYEAGLQRPYEGIVFVEISKNDFEKNN
ncbi:MAG TPA: sialidase family protein [Chitinophagaceae bacterium]|jgi:sialidase-1|nr:sialidase family protein [Chitinophagaceae bacterium]